MLVDLDNNMVRDDLLETRLPPLPADAVATFKSRLEGGGEGGGGRKGEGERERE